jgi:urea transporter
MPPQWTWAFNIVTITALLVRNSQLLATTATTGSTTADDAATATTTTTTLVLAVETATAASITPLWDVALSPLTGLSQIFLVQSPWTGLGIVAALATYSPGMARHAVMGSSVGCIMGAAMYDVPLSEIASGLWGYNAALTSVGVSVFFVPSWSSTALSVAGAMATSAVYGALAQPASVLIAAAGVPCLTLPFCITMSACWLLGSSSIAPRVLPPGTLTLAPHPHSPERNAVVEESK